MNHTELTNKGQKGPKGPKGQAGADGGVRSAEVGGQTGDREIREKGRRARSDAPYQSEANRGRERGRGGLGAARAELVGVLEEFGISPGTFDGLRSDCYEKHIAARSLAELKTVYFSLLQPGTPSEELREKFPRWSEEHRRFGGQRPSITTLMGIKNRMLAEQTANEVGNLMQQVQMIHNQTGKLPGDFQGQVYNAMLAVIGQELFKAKFEGKPMSQNLAVVDRLMKAAVIRYRERQGDKRNEQRDRAHQIQEGRLALARERVAAPKLSSKAKAELKEQPVPLPVSQETAEEMIERIYGKNPYKTVEGPRSKVEGQTGSNVNHQDAQAQSGETKIQNPESKLQGNANNQAPMTEQTVKENGNKIDNRETREICETGAAKGEKETVLRELREGDKPQETKVDNLEIGKIREKGEQQVGLVELVPPVEVKTAAAKVDTRPEWAKRPANKLIGGRSAKHPKGIWRCDDTGLPVDVATGKPVEDVDWTTLIGFGGDGEKPLN